MMEATKTATSACRNGKLSYGAAKDSSWLSKFPSSLQWQEQLVHKILDLHQENGEDTWFCICNEARMELWGFAASMASEQFSNSIGKKESSLQFGKKEIR